MKLYQTGTNAAYAEYLKIKSVMPNGGCGLNDDEEAWLCAYLECNPRLNSRLSEAAPDLLAALESVTLAIEQLVDIKQGSPVAFSVRKARAAISKARGE